MGVMFELIPLAGQPDGRSGGWAVVLPKLTPFAQQSPIMTDEECLLVFT